ncbi:hypothetical protein D3C75_809420 [compost metagenome]
MGGNLQKKQKPAAGPAGLKVSGAFGNAVHQHVYRPIDLFLIINGDFRQQNRMGQHHADDGGDAEADDAETGSLHNLALLLEVRV